MPLNLDGTLRRAHEVSITRSMKSETEKPDRFAYERTLWEAGKLHVAGVDEVGRGPLAGPVIACAVILPHDFDDTGITDSKKMTEAARERAYTRLCNEAVAYALGILDAPEIDRLNILRATHQAMRLALAALSVAPDAVLVDGLPVPNLHVNSTAIVKGDSLSASIAAASIIAKVTRDRYMAGEAHTAYPVYGFAGHKGYPAPTHLAALVEHGPCPLHRRSFGPVAQVALCFDDAA